MSDKKNEFSDVLECEIKFDRIVIDPDRNGKEANESTFFDNFQEFAAQDKHSLFKGRTVGTVGLSNTNQRMSDKNQLPFYAVSPGIRFCGPGIGITQELRSQPRVKLASLTDPNLRTVHFWEVELLRMCAIELKVGQDIIAEGPAQNFPACLGAYYADGFNVCDGIPRAENIDDASMGENTAFFNFGYVTGHPNIQNRRVFQTPIGIPKDEIIEMVLVLSREAREYLNQLRPVAIPLTAHGEAVGKYNMIPARFTVEGTFVGARSVQKRGELRFSDGR
jgi:hypothetical protein